MSDEQPDTSKYPPRPEEYTFSNHFTDDVITDRDRHLDWKKVFGTIRHGEMDSAPGNADAEFCRDYHGVKVYVLVGYDGAAGEPVVITGWPAVHDPSQAVESGRWTEQQLREINEFNGGDSLEADFDYYS